MIPFPEDMKLMKLINSVSFVAVAMLLAACGGGGEAPPSSFPGLTLDGDSAYLASNAHVHKFDPATGKEIWRYPAVGQTFPSGETHGPFAGEPLRFKDWVIVGGASGANGIPDASLYALDEKTGGVTWRWSVPGTTEQERREFADGVVTDGKLLFAANGNGTLYALDPAALENGVPQVAWKFATGNKLWSRPLIADGRVFQSSLDHTLYARDAATGKELWRFQAGASVASTPAIQDGVLYFGAFDGYFHAVDAATGAEKWKSVVDAWVWTRALVHRDAPRRRLAPLRPPVAPGHPVPDADGERHQPPQRLRPRPVCGGADGGLRPAGGGGRSMTPRRARRGRP